MRWCCAECKWLGIAWVTVFDDGDIYNKGETQIWFKNFIREFIDYQYRHNFSPPLQAPYI